MFGAQGVTRKVIIRPNGTIEYIYDDTFKSLLKLGKAEVKRASHVEPSSDGSTWSADLSPVNGPTLSGFETRDKALAAEEKWINENYLCSTK